LRNLGPAMLLGIGISFAPPNVRASSPGVHLGVPGAGGGAARGRGGAANGPTRLSQASAAPPLGPPGTPRPPPTQGAWDYG
jgi:hypothetical protein